MKKQTLFKPTTIKVEVSHNLVRGSHFYGHAECIEVPNVELTGYRLGNNPCTASDPRKVISGDYSIDIESFKKLTINKGEILDGLVYGLRDGHVVLGLPSMMRKKQNFVSITHRDIGKRVIVVGRADPVTYAGYMTKISTRTPANGASKKVHVYRTNQGKYFYSHNSLVVKVTNSVDKWKTHSIIRVSSAKHTAVLALNPEISVKVTPGKESPDMYRVIPIIGYVDGNPVSKSFDFSSEFVWYPNNTRVPIKRHQYKRLDLTIKGQLTFVITTPHGVMEI